MGMIFGPSGFGVGAVYGTPITVGMGATSTTSITGTVYATRPYYLANNTNGSLAGVNLVAISTTNSVTATMTLFSGSGGHFYNDNVSWTIVNTTTTVQIVLIPA